MQSQYALGKTSDQIKNAMDDLHNAPQAVVNAAGFSALQKQNPDLAKEFTQKAAQQQQERITALETQVAALTTIQEDPAAAVAMPAVVNVAVNSDAATPTKQAFRRVKVPAKYTR